jgi:RNA polymerase sigma-B factor
MLLRQARPRVLTAGGLGKNAVTIVAGDLKSPDLQGGKRALARTALKATDTETLIAELGRTGDPALRDAIIERHQHLVRSLAQKFSRPGVPAEDLIQTAWLALIRALDRFDPAHQTQFSTYAIHCMVGEIKRYFRDRTWSMKVPRVLQEISSNLPRTQDQLVRKLGRQPSMAEMADSFGVSEETLAEAMELQHVYQMSALEERVDTESGEGRAVSDVVGEEDGRLRDMVEHAPLYAALQALEPRDQLVIRRRFYDGFSQAEVAAELGLSQMHISRLERGALKRLREVMQNAAAIAGGDLALAA